MKAGQRPALTAIDLSRQQHDDVAMRCNLFAIKYVGTYIPLAPGRKKPENYAEGCAWPCAWEAHGLCTSDLVECLRQVGLQVIDVLDADRKAHHAFAHTVGRWSWSWRWVADAG